MNLIEDVAAAAGILAVMAILLILMSVVTGWS